MAGNPLYRQCGKSESNVAAVHALHLNAWSSPNGMRALEERSVSESIFHDPAMAVAKPLLSVVDWAGKIESNIAYLHLNPLNVLTAPSTILDLDEATVSESIFMGSAILLSRNLPATGRRKDFWPFFLRLLG